MTAVISRAARACLTLRLALSRSIGVIDPRAGRFRSVLRESSVSWLAD